MDETTQRLYAAVSSRAEGTPYVVMPTDRGFDVHLDIANAHWFGLFGDGGLEKSVIQHVAVSGEHVTITDDTREVRWNGAVPVLSASWERTLGRSYQFSFEKAWVLDESGRPEKVLDYTFSSKEGRSLVQAAIAEVGLKERMPWVAKSALIFGIGTVVLLVLIGIGLGTAALLGVLP